MCVTRDTVQLSQSLFENSSRVISGTNLTFNTIKVLMEICMLMMRSLLTMLIHAMLDLRGIVKTANAAGMVLIMQCKAVSCTLTMFLAARPMSTAWQQMQLG